MTPPSILNSTVLLLTLVACAGAAKPAAGQLVNYKVRYNVTQSFLTDKNFFAIGLHNDPEDYDTEGIQGIIQNRTDWREFTPGEHTIVLTDQSIGAPHRLQINVPYHYENFVIGPFTVECPGGERICFNEQLFLLGKNGQLANGRQTTVPGILLTDRNLPLPPPKSDHDQWWHEVLYFENFGGQARQGLQASIKSPVIHDAEVLNTELGQWEAVNLTPDGLPGERCELHKAYQDKKKDSPADFGKKHTVTYDLPEDGVLFIHHAGRVSYKCQSVKMGEKHVLMRFAVAPFETDTRTEIVLPQRDDKGSVVSVPWSRVRRVLYLLGEQGDEELSMKIGYKKKLDWIAKGWIYQDEIN